MSGRGASHPHAPARVRGEELEAQVKLADGSPARVELGPWIAEERGATTPVDGA